LLTFARWRKHSLPKASPLQPQFGSYGIGQRLGISTQRPWAPGVEQTRARISQNSPDQQESFVGEQVSPTRAEPGVLDNPIANANESDMPIVNGLDIEFPRASSTA
jgi:hypothetical protein